MTNLDKVNAKPVHEQIMDTLYKRLKHDGILFLVLGGLIGAAMLVSAVVGVMRLIDEQAANTPVAAQQR